MCLINIISNTLITNNIKFDIFSGTGFAYFIAISAVLKIKIIDITVALIFEKGMSFLIAKNIAQSTTHTISRYGKIIMDVPAAVANPLPPLNSSQGLKQCAKIANIDETA